MTLSCHGLREHINYLKISGNMRKRDNTIVQGFPNRMTAYLNMLRTFMVNRINSYLNGTSIVSMKRSGIRLRKTKLSQKPTKSNNLRTSSGYCPVFGFSRLFRNASLFLTLPRNQRITKKHAPTRDKPSSIRTSGPIHIPISNKAKRRVDWEEEPTSR
jgi:hypothetical protein